MRKARCIVAVLLAYVLAFGLDYGGMFLHRADFDKAVTAYAKNATPENQAALERERHINHLIRMHDAAIVAAIEVGVVCGFWVLLTLYYKRKRGLSKSKATP